MIQTREIVETDFFEEVTTTADWQLVDIDFLSASQVIVNIGTASVEFSYDGSHTHGILAGGDSVSFDNRRRSRLWFRNGTGSSTAHLFAWREP